MIPVWCTHASDHRSATRAAVGIRPSRSQPRQYRAARKHETVKPAKKKEETAERYRYFLLTGEAIYLLCLIASDQPFVRGDCVCERCRRTLESREEAVRCQ